MQKIIFKVLSINLLNNSIIFEYGYPMIVNNKLIIDSTKIVEVNFNIPKGFNNIIAENVVINAILNKHPNTLVLSYDKYATSIGLNNVSSSELVKSWRKKFRFERFYKSKICKWLFPKKI